MSVLVSEAQSKHSAYLYTTLRLMVRPKLNFGQGRPSNARVEPKPNDRVGRLLPFGCLSAVDIKLLLIRASVTFFGTYSGQMKAMGSSL